MSINENDVIAAVLGHMGTVGYNTSVDDHSPSDFARVTQPFAYVSNVNTVREAVDDAQTTDTTNFVLNLWREAKKRTEVIADIQALIALLEGDTTLAGVCDLCQAGDMAEIGGQDVDGQMTFVVLDITARFVS